MTAVNQTYPQFAAVDLNALEEWAYEVGNKPVMDLVLELRVARRVVVAASDPALTGRLSSPTAWAELEEALAEFTALNEV